MFNRITRGLVAAAFTFAAGSVASGQVILMNDATADTVQVLDRTTGDPLGTFDVSFSSLGIAVIDGPGGTLLMSDQSGDTIWRMNANGSLIGQYISAPIDNLRGINLLPNGYVVGAAASGIFAWDRNGDVLSQNIPGDFFDVFYVQNRLVASDLGDDTVDVYNLSGQLIGGLPNGTIDFPEQATLINTTNGPRVAVAGFTAQSVTIITPSGTVESTFPITGSGRGIIQAGNGNLLVSSNSGLYEYGLDGTLIRTIMTGSGFRYLHLSRNYAP